ncbi:MAG: peptidase [Desulfuromonadaceae bacterium GWC2_58_13]|nr:MAG: peptidase [Desulfuromonadaceae bacterium GWC2_58_13]
MEHILAKISIMLVPALLAITLHEVAHGYVAERLGDPTARLLGRLTLNPFKHLDPIGTVALLFVGFGWARPVPVNFGNLRHPKKDMIWVALAGPLMNFSLAVLSMLLLKSFTFLGHYFPSGTVALILQPLSLMAAFGLYINVILAVFNMLPIPPLDGGRVLIGLLPEKQGDFLARFESFGFVIIIFAIFATPVWPMLLQPVISFVVGMLAGSDLDVVVRVVTFLFSH